MTGDVPTEEADRRRPQQRDRHGERLVYRRRRREDVFGEVLPEQTRDDAEPPGDAGSGEDGADAWLRAQVPPHHGG